jgi:hypothetical protein
MGKNETVVVNNYMNINKTINLLSPQTIEHKKKDHDIYADGPLGPDSR